MFKEQYKHQVDLLIRCLPFVEKQECFAIKGGTAINLFIQNMPRLSVDIDLTYLPLKNRDESLKEIGAALLKIKKGIEKFIPNSHVTVNSISNIPGKLIVLWNDVQIKIEVNFVLRGSVYDAEPMEICKEVQNLFQQFAKVRILSKEDLYAGKICAALDRQHPRDLFDVMLLLNEGDISLGTRKAFVVYLAGHSRPMHELLNPKLKDLKNVFESQFDGMTRESVFLNDLYATREKLIDTIHNSLTPSEKQFLISIKKADPDWDVLGLKHIKNLPSLQWKLINIRKMTIKKRRETIRKLEKVLNL
jgi:predicted nucleotidyltransferase component of viral defense system